MDTEQLVVAGMTGSGKSQLVRQLLATRAHPRVVALDPLGDDYRELPGVEGFGPFADAWRNLYRDSRFQLRQTAVEIEEHLRTLELVNRTLRRGRSRPTLIVMEEASFLSSTGSIPDPVRETITKGRHFGLSVISVSQRTTQVHPDVQQSASTLALFKSRKPAGWVRDFLPSATDRLRELEKYSREEYEAGAPVEKGRHYITDPEDADLEERLRRVAE